MARFDAQGNPPGVKDKGDVAAPDPRVVMNFHARSDVDSKPWAHHHTIGTRPNQVASGAHNHNGINSNALLAGITLTGAKGGNTALASVIAALVTLGATDSTTA